jgi:hypothetical protein
MPPQHMAAMHCGYISEETPEGRPTLNETANEVCKSVLR